MMSTSSELHSDRCNQHPFGAALSLSSSAPKRLWGQYTHIPRVAVTLAKTGCTVAALGRYYSYGEHREVDSLLGEAGRSEAGEWTVC